MVNTRAFPSVLKRRGISRQIYGGVELVCAVYPYGYSGDSCPDYQAKKRLQVTRYFSQNNNTQARLTGGVGDLFVVRIFEIGIKSKGCG